MKSGEDGEINFGEILFHQANRDTLFMDFLHQNIPPSCCFLKYTRYQCLALAFDFIGNHDSSKHGDNKIVMLFHSNKSSSVRGKAARGKAARESTPNLPYMIILT